MDFFSDHQNFEILKVKIIRVKEDILKYNPMLAKVTIALSFYIIDTFQDFLIAEHMKPRMHVLEISISSLNHVIVRPTKTPKSADKNANF